MRTYRRLRYPIGYQRDTNVPASRLVAHRRGLIQQVSGERGGEVLKLLGIWRGASFACESTTGFGRPSKGAPHGDEITCFAAHAGRVDGVDRGSSFHTFSEGRTG